MKWPISPKAIELKFKIINGYYSAADTLKDLVLRWSHVASVNQTVKLLSTFFIHVQ